MRILNLAEFREMPDGTLFRMNTCNGELLVKGRNMEFDFTFCLLAGEIDCDTPEQASSLEFKAEEDSSISIPLDFDCYQRDGMYNKNQLFSVYEKKDYEDLLSKLKQCGEAYK